MSELTKEYLDKKLDSQTQEIKSYVDDKVSFIDEKIDGLARMTANGLEEIKSELNVKKEVDNLNRRISLIEQALNIKN